MKSRKTNGGRALAITLVTVSLGAFGMSAIAGGNSQANDRANENSQSSISYAWNATDDMVTIASSPKALGYVVVLYCDGVVEKVSDVTGNQVTLEGGGMIQSVMVKAGSTTDTTWAPRACVAGTTRPPGIPW